MKRYIRYGTLVAAALLGGSACESNSTAPGDSQFYPAAEYISASEAKPPVSRVSGLAWDPEAFFMSIAFCGRDCPIPPFLSETSPLYLRSAVRGATVTLFDGAAFKPLTSTASSNGGGEWLMTDVPSRDGAPFLPIAFGTGALPTEQIGPPLPPTPPSEYVPTLTVRPIVTRHATCAGMDAAHVSKNGVLEAVAKFLTVTSTTGTITTVDDLLNPAKFHAIHYFWFYHPGNPALKAPADGVGLEAAFGQILPIDWAPPGIPPENLRSTRGFIVDPSKPSPLGLNVVVIPNNGPVDFINHYKVVDVTGQADTPENKANLRPWFFPPIEGHVVPGQVTFIGLQLWYSNVATSPPGYPPPPSLCLP